MTKTTKPKRIINKAERYHCPNCGSENSMFPEWIGRRRFYRCDICKEPYSSAQLDKSWGVKGKNTLECLHF